MPYPVQIDTVGFPIDPVGRIGVGATGLPTVDQRCGPFRNDDDLYVFLVEGTSNSAAHVECWKSSDEGLTWARQNSINEPDIRAGSPSLDDRVTISCSAYPDLTVSPLLYVLYWHDSDDKLRVKSFNVVQDLWKATSAAGPVAVAFSATNQRDERFILTYRLTGVNSIEFPIAFNGATDTVSSVEYERVWYTIYRKSTNTWDTEVRLFGSAGVGDHYFLEAGIEGRDTGVGQGRRHFFARKKVDASAVTTLTHRSAESNDTLNSIEEVSSKDVAAGRPSGGATIRIPYLDEFAGEQLYVADADSSASMVWSETQALDDDLFAFNNDKDHYRLIQCGDDLRIYFTTLRVSDEELVYIESLDGGATWGDIQLVHGLDNSDDIFEVAGECHQEANGQTHYGILYDYGNGGVRPAFYTQQDGPLVSVVEINNGIFEAPGGYVVA